MDDEVRAATARALRAMRESKGYSQSFVAEALDLPQSAVSRWEAEGSTGRTPDVRNMARLSALYGVPEHPLIPRAPDADDIVAEARRLEAKINARKGQKGDG